MPDALRRLFTCLAFATWCFLNTWVELAEGRFSYFARYDPLHTVVLPVLCCEILIAAAMFASWEVLSRWPVRRGAAVHFLFLASCCVPLGIGAVALLRVLPFDVAPWVRRPWFWPLAILAGAAPLVYALIRPRRAARLLCSLFLYSWPALAVILFYAARSVVRFPPSAYADRALATPLPTDPQPVRVVWIVFDELSREIAFSNRPASLQVPNLDRLKQESFYATAAQSPSFATETSLPALILGSLVASVQPDGPDRLLLHLRRGSKAVDWGTMDNVFDRARALGDNTAVAGWYHPYGRLLNRSLSQCYWVAGSQPPGIEEYAVPREILPAIWDRLRLQFVALPVAGHLPGVDPLEYERRSKIEKYQSLLHAAEHMAADASIGLALLHLPVPHPPGIYSRSDHQFHATKLGGYLDSVALADQSLGLLRHSIEEAGLWPGTAIIVSSDHGWRADGWRGGPGWTAEDEAISHQGTMGIPFLLRLPGQATGLLYPKRFNTVLSRRIITAILEGRLTDPARISEVIER